VSRSGDWVPIRGYGSLVILTAGSQSVDFVLVRHGSETDPTASTMAIVEHGDEILTQRVIGQVRIQSGSPVFCCMRIRVGLYDDNLDQAAFYATGLFDPDGAEEPFLWQRYLTVGSAFVDTLDVALHPWWSSFDVRVARKLPRDQALFLSVQAQAQGEDAVTVQPFVRTRARALGG